MALAPQVRNEIAVLKRVSAGHPNICRLVDHFETAHNLYLVFDLCTGGELFDRICSKGNYYERWGAAWSMRGRGHFTDAITGRRLPHHPGTPRRSSRPSPRRSSTCTTRASCTAVSEGATCSLGCRVV